MFTVFVNKTTGPPSLSVGLNAGTYQNS